MKPIIRPAPHGQRLNEQTPFNAPQGFGLQSIPTKQAMKVRR